MFNDMLRLASIKEAIMKIAEYSKEFLNAEDFYHYAKSFDASMMQFVVIAEMIEKFKLKHAEIEWQKIKPLQKDIGKFLKEENI